MRLFNHLRDHFRDNPAWEWLKAVALGFIVGNLFHHFAFHSV
jgi:hypothetical protein